jgi:hypothetical protein
MTYKLLLVEDNQFIGSLIEAIFSGRKYTIIGFRKEKMPLIISKKVCMIYVY